MKLARRIGWSIATYMARTLSTYRLRRLATMFAEHARPLVERQSFTCPLCGYEGRFEPYFGSVAMRFDAQCPACHSRERHRFLKLWMDDDPRGVHFGDMLHFAPEPELEAALRSRCNSYKTADIMPGRAHLVLNIESIDMPDVSMDTIMANHVLEHVNDSKALAELYRVLRPGGLAILTFPVISSWDTSYEDPAITDPIARYRHFGQDDHVRYFGRDVEDRIKAAGFVLEVITADGPASVLYALTRGASIYLATRPAE